MRVVATAGHVDHGKSTLVRALTGTDPDRLAEEKRRGLTIDLGFAHTTLPSGIEISFIDVPGHVRFLKNMLAGVGGAEACLFVVAATEGWKPQSEEHLRILSLLGLRHGLIALTKVALVDSDRESLVRLEVEDRVRGTFLESAAVIAVDVPAGRGIQDLVAAADTMLTHAPRPPEDARPRLWVDRVFSARGSGTVVTGTLTGGRLHVDDTVSVVRVASTAVGSVLTARVRSLQTHGRSTDHAEAGSRVALNLSGIRRDEIERGDAVVLPGRWHLTSRVDAALEVLGSLDHDVSRRGAYEVSIGSGHHHARLRILGRSALTPGSRGLVRLRLDAALPLLPGDRYVLREDGRSETIGGGEILDVEPIRAASKAAPDRSIERIVSERGSVELTKLATLTADTWAGDVLAARWAIDSAELARLSTTLLAAIEDAATTGGIDIATLGARERAVLERLATDPSTRPAVHITTGRARVANAAASSSRHRCLVALEADPFNPPDPAPADRSTLRELERAGFVVERDGVWFAASTVEKACGVIAALLKTRDGVTVAEVRDALASTRKHVLPLLAYLDATGRTRRRGDLRIAGPLLQRGVGSAGPSSSSQGDSGQGI